jgi:cytochrome c5
MKTRTIIATLTLAALTATSAFAFDGGNPRKGRSLYQKTCKTCHVDGAEGKALSPTSKTQSQWGRYFDRGDHPNKAEAWKGLSERDRNDIRQYLNDHAADSDQPETCG